MQSSDFMAPGALRNVPVAHGIAAAAPNGQYEPASHTLHAVCCGASWYVPGSHCLQMAVPFEAA